MNNNVLGRKLWHESTRIRFTFNYIDACDIQFMGLIIILLSILNCYITLKIIIDILQQNTIFVPQNAQQRTTENYRHIQRQITS